ncbi:MAG: DUF3795 domain-containing protein [Ignavibacteriales bacterium]|nr:DUF3795 domain-containing protein [Ignavibacteriales bacterium]
MSMIAPCGMNCGICLAHLREKNHCDGCNSLSKNKPPYCERCIIKNCKELKESGSKYCFACNAFPCKRLRQLDKRYSTKYGMSMIENLLTIERSGIRSFVKQEAERWRCEKCGSTICVHRPECLVCGTPKLHN